MKLLKKNVQLPKMYFEGKDTLITDSCQDFRLNYWAGKRCDGKTVFGKSWKPTGKYDLKTHFVTTQGSEVSADSLQKILQGEGYSGTTQKSPLVGSNDSPFDFMPYWLGNILKLLWYLVALLIAGWLVYNAIRWLYNNRVMTPNPPANNQNHQQTIHQAPPAPAKVEEIIALVSAISAGGGGSVNTEGMLIVINGVQAPLVTIKHSGVGNYTGDVIIGDSIKGDIALFESDKKQP